jgi:hypothetical protein
MDNVQNTTKEVNGRTDLVLLSSDIMLLAKVSLKVDKYAKNVLHSDINPQLITDVVVNTTELAKQVIRGHQFMSMDDYTLYEFKYMKVRVDNIAKTLEVKPYFEPVRSARHDLFKG